LICNWFRIANRFSVLLCLAFALTACSTASDKFKRTLKVGEPVARVYNAKYEEVEAAIKQAMIRYPQRVDNTEAGIFETDYVKGEARFKSPGKNNDESSGNRYRILIRLVRGKNDDRSAVKVIVTKQGELARDFFANAEPVPSDGLEETAILYRVGREIVLARAILKSTERENKKQDESL
jgi:hypothetical protein